MTPFRLRRGPRWWVACLTLFAVLYAQLALAAYACPAGEAALQACAQGAAACAGMDTERPALCHAHTHKDPASAERAPAAMPLPMLLALVQVILPAPLLQGAVAPPAAAGLAPSAPGDPPLSIRFCSFQL
ncbi:MAG: hypothetical protein ACXU8N_06440 [Telluria sp.]